MQTTENRFDVYEHLRSDTGAVFHVGKVTGKRYAVRSHHHCNDFWQRTERKAGVFRVRMAARNVDEELAFMIEQERISQLHMVGVSLCNMADGGDGTTGRVKTKQSASMIGKSQRVMTCLHCGKAGGNSMKRWNFDNGKEKT